MTKKQVHMPLRALKRIQLLFDGAMPNLSARERQLIILIAEEQVRNSDMNVKRLVFSQDESPTTVRRRVDRLIKAGYLLRRLKENDGRSYVLLVSEPMLSRLIALEEPLTQILEALKENEAEKSQVLDRLQIDRVQE